MSGERPTVAECMALLGQTYKPEGVRIVWEGRIGALGGRRPMDLMGTAAGRREVFDWALGLAGGVMG